MLSLAIETSGRTATVALWQDDRPIAERALPDIGRRHAQSLVTEIDRLFRESGATLDSCQFVAVSIGPGSFTGLRVGVVCAKTLAYAIRSRLVAVDTFECIACNSPEDVREVLVISDAQRGGLFVGRYLRQTSETWHRDGDISIVDATDWVRARVSTDVVSGWGATKILPALADRCRVLDREFWTPAASTVVRIGRRLAEHHQFADCMTLEPFYLRQSAAEEKAGESGVPSPEAEQSQIQSPMPKVGKKDRGCG